MCMEKDMGVPAEEQREGIFSLDFEHVLHIVLTLNGHETNQMQVY